MQERDGRKEEGKAKEMREKMEERKRNLRMDMC